MSKEIEISNNSDESESINDEGKKSVEDILAETQELGNNIAQAINTYTINTINFSTQSLGASSSGNISGGSCEGGSGAGIGGKTPSPKTTPKYSSQISSLSTSSSSSSSTSSTSTSSSSSATVGQKLVSQSPSALATTSNIDNTSDNSSSGKTTTDGKKTPLLDNIIEVTKKLELQNLPNSEAKTISKISDRAKKKSWYSALYPSYKSRSEDFKKLFKDVPDDERLVVDYSCAVQRDILVHGRLYVSQNYLCFYANIFRWETCLCIKWKDVTSVTKEKTARVIPNAILVSAGNDKFFFTSFTTRDKAYLMLFRVWQNALMDKQMQPQEMWQWVHNCYGDELGLTSDDEDYIDPNIQSEKESNQLEASPSPSGISLNQLISSDDYHPTNTIINNDLIIASDIMGGGTTEDSELSRSRSGGEKSSDGHKKKLLHVPSANNELTKKKITKNIRQRDENLLQQNKKSEHHHHHQLPTDMSDSSDSDQNKIPFVSTAECTSMHEGRQLVHTILSINIDNLFNLLFSKSKFLVEFHTERKSTDMNFGEWGVGPNGLKTRTVKVTVALAQSVGPKTSQVTETQVMRECSKPGELYSIDVNSVNANIPYADTFCVDMHYCLVRTVDDHTMLSVHAQIKYKKSIWGVVKGFIERNTWAGLEHFYNALLAALQNECCIPPAKAKSRRQRKHAANSPRATLTSDEPINLTQIHQDSIRYSTETEISHKFLLSNEKEIKYKWISWFVIILLTALIILNVILLVKLWKIENQHSSISQVHNVLTMKDLPKTHKEWVELLKHQEALHETEMRKWQVVLQTAIELLKKVSIVCKTIINNKNLTEFISNLHEHNEL